MESELATWAWTLAELQAHKMATANVVFAANEPAANNLLSKHWAPVDRPWLVDGVEINGAVRGNS